MLLIRFIYCPTMNVLKVVKSLNSEISHALQAKKLAGVTH